MRSGRAMRSGGSMRGWRACRRSLRGRAGISAMRRCSGVWREACPTAAARCKVRATAAAGEETAAATAARAGIGQQRMSEARERALAEIAYCEALLAKSGLNVLSETFRDVGNVAQWDHYPPGDVYDPASGAQWFYHCHPAEEGEAEHGHFHCFVRPAGTDGPIHHLAAVGVDAYGRLQRIFTVNQWVVGDDWLDAESTVALLPRFDVQMPRPSYLVNRWLTGIIAAHEGEIADLIRQRDRTLAAHVPADGSDARADRTLEVTSELLLA